MPKVNVTVDFDTYRVVRRLNNEQFGTAIAQAAARGMDRYVPYRTGALSKNIKEEPFKVTYQEPYAGYVYYGDRMQFRHDVHPLATARWADVYARNQGQALARRVKQLTKKYL